MSFVTISRETGGTDKQYHYSSRDPDWSSIETAYQAGKTLTNLWLAYRATVSEPYAYGRFLVRRQLWAKAGKPAPRSSGDGRAKPQKSPPAPIEIVSGLAYIEAPGTALQVRAGALAIRFADGSERHFRPSEHRLDTIVLAGHGASVTSEAVRWLIADNVMLLIAGRNNEAFAMFDTSPLIDASRNALALRRKQFGADPVKVARTIVSRKIEASELPPDVARPLLSKFRAGRTVMDARAIEAKAAEACWRRWYGTPLRFNGTVPDHWRTFSQRMVKRHGGKLGEKGAQFGARDATHPANAALNYAYAVALSRMTRVIIARGLDPAFGFLHSDKPGRMSLAYDCVELLRPALTEAVMRWMTEGTFRKGFATFEGGIVRLSSEVARDVAALTIKAVPLARYVAIVREVERMF